MSYIFLILIDCFIAQNDIWLYFMPWSISNQIEVWKHSRWIYNKYFLTLTDMCGKHNYDIILVHITISIQRIEHLARERAASICCNCEEFILSCLGLRGKHVDYGNVWFWMVSSKWYLLHMEQFWGVMDGAGAGGGLGKGGDVGRDGFEGTQSQMKTRPGGKGVGDGKALLWLAMGVCLSEELLP